MAERKRDKKEVERMLHQREQNPVYHGRKDDTMQDLAENGMLTSKGWKPLRKRKST